jgi:hypothetical protein
MRWEQRKIKGSRLLNEGANTAIGSLMVNTRQPPMISGAMIQSAAKLALACWANCDGIVGRERSLACAPRKAARPPLNLR